MAGCRAAAVTVTPVGGVDEDHARFHGLHVLVDGYGPGEDEDDYSMVFLPPKLNEDLEIA